MGGGAEIWSKKQQRFLHLAKLPGMEPETREGNICVGRDSKRGILFFLDCRGKVWLQRGEKKKKKKKEKENLSRFKYNPFINSLSP